MADVKETYGNCEAKICTRPERGILKSSDRIVVGGKQYHPECAPTREERTQA